MIETGGELKEKPLGCLKSKRVCLCTNNRVCTENLLIIRAKTNTVDPSKSEEGCSK